MWDSGMGMCIGCKKQADRDILGRCNECFKAGLEVKYGHFKEMEHVHGKVYASKAHIKDLEDRRWHPTEKRQFYRSKEPGRTHFLPKG
jgi:hypothetical protein